MTLRYFSKRRERDSVESERVTESRETFTEYVPIEGDRIGYNITRDKHTKEEISRTVPIFFSHID